MDAINTLAAFQPNVQMTFQSYVFGSKNIIIHDISSSVPSVVYMVLVSYKNITKNQITKKTSITIKPVITPTSSQIASCKDGND